MLERKFPLLVGALGTLGASAQGGACQGCSHLHGLRTHPFRDTRWRVRRATYSSHDAGGVLSVLRATLAGITSVPAATAEWDAYVNLMKEQAIESSGELDAPLAAALTSKLEGVSR